MSDKTYIYEQTPNQSVDAATAALLAGKNNGGLFGSNGIEGLIGLIIAAGIFGGGNGNGLFGGGNNNTEREMLMQAITRNGNDINSLAAQYNCSTGQVTAAINALSTQLATFAGQQGMTSMQVINAIQAGNCTLSHQLAECCCSTKQVISEGFASLGYATRDQTCAIEKAIAASTEQILAGQRAAEMRDLQNKLDAEREKVAQQANAINNYQQTQTFANMLQQATQPLLVGLQKVQGDVDGIICKLPKTVTLPYADAQAIPNCLYYNLFGAPLGNPNGSFF